MSATIKDEHTVSGKDRFGRFASYASISLGSRWAFYLAIAVVVAWAISGPIFHYSDTWQLIINTGTTIVTFLMVFLIQNTQNRDARAINLKLDELIRAIDTAKNPMINIEHLSDEQLAAIFNQYKLVPTADKKNAEKTEDSKATKTNAS